MEKNLVDAIANLKSDETMVIVKEKLEAGENPLAIIELCRQGITIVGERFEKKQYSLSDLIVTALDFNDLMKLILSHLKVGQELKTIGRVIIGTVETDIHDIGKNIVISLLRANEFEVIDLGVDVPPERFVQAAKETGAQIIGLSALVTTGIDSMKTIIEALSNVGLRGKVRIIVGGGCVSKEVAEVVGADAYGNNATEAVRLAKEFVKER